MVRSEAAAATLADHADVSIVDYAHAKAVRDACAGCSCVAHLVGIVKESARATYASAHEESSRALVRAASEAGIRRIVYLSILGAHENSPNACLASKARAEAILLESAVPSLVIRVPMVLGEGDYASAALLAKARRRVAFEFRASSSEQPIYAGDVVEAILAGLAPDGPVGVLELAGPRSLSRRELIGVASGVGTRVVSLPLPLGYALAWMLERLGANPPLTRPMLGVLDHDDDIDAQPGAEALGIRLTGLEDTLARVSG